MNNSYLPWDISTPPLPLCLTSSASEQQPDEAKNTNNQGCENPLKQEINLFFIHNISYKVNQQKQAKTKQKLTQIWSNSWFPMTDQFTGHTNNRGSIKLDHTDVICKLSTTGNALRQTT